MADKLIPVFTHIPKTAGTNLHRIIEWQYAFKPGLIYSAADIPYLDRFKILSSKEKEKIKLIRGHSYFGIHQYFQLPVRYFTILRQPQKRTISNYYHILRWYKYHPGLKKLQLNKYSLKEFLEKGILDEMDNCQVRYLSGVPNIPYGGVNEEHLQTAIHNLKTYYPVIGITEFFTESVLMFAKELGWTDPYYIDSNVSPVKTNEVNIDEETQKLLNHYNRYDEILYKKALEIFNEQLVQAGPGFKNEVAAFVEENKKRRVSTIARIHLTSKLRYFNKYHLWNIQRYILEHLKTL